MTYLSILVVICMLYQHMTITKVSRVREDFYPAWTKYRRHIVFCRCLSLAGLGLIIVIIVETYYAGDQVTRSMMGLLETKEYTSLIMLTFFISVLKVLLEDHVERNLLRTSPGLGNVWLKDIWLVWFFASVVFSVLLGGSEFLDRESIDRYSHLLAPAMVIVVTLTYDFWIYNVFYRQLTDGDGFMGSAVSQIYRTRPGNPLQGFVGFLFHSIQYQPPAQVMIIGPTGAGKTRWTMSHDAAYARRVTDRGAETAEGLVSTQVVEVANKIEAVRVSNGTEAGFSLQLLDFPGENIGDHCTVPFDLRCDVLVLILPETAFNPSLATRPETFSVTTSEDLNEYFDIAEGVNKTRDYVYALYFGLNIDSGSTVNVAGRQRFGIGSFVLIVNSRKDELAFDDHFTKHVNALAAELAKKFGLTRADRCLAYYCNILKTTEPILSEAIRRLHGSPATAAEPSDLVER